MLSLLSFIAIFVVFALIFIGSILGCVSFVFSLKSRKTIRVLKSQVEVLTRDNESLIAVVNGEQARVTNNELLNDLEAPQVTTKAKQYGLSPRYSKILERWMIWFGVLSITLSGGFMVRYSVDAGVLTRDLGIVFAFLIGGLGFAGRDV